MTKECNCRRKAGHEPDVRDALCRLIEGTDDPCPVHAADEVRRRQVEAEANRYRDALEASTAEHQQTDDLAARRKERDQRTAALATLAQADPLLADLVHRTGAPISSLADIPLNATATEIAPRLGMTPHSPTDGPLDAA